MLTHGLDWTYQYLRSQGVRITPQRQAVLEYLDKTESHPTAETIYNSLKSKFEGLSLATVYNILHLFKDHGVVMELSYGDSSSRFDGNAENHYHITCSRCGKVEDYHRDLVPEIEEEAERATGFKVQYHRVEFVGICPECARRNMQ